jgi:hypothetical protein
MKVKDLILVLKGLNPERDIVLSSDEELNTLYREFEVSELEGENRYVIWGYSTSAER